MSTSPDVTPVDGSAVRRKLYNLHQNVSGIELPTWENPLRLLVTGSRNWVDVLVPACVFSALSFTYGALFLMHGAARGLDTVADKIVNSTPGWVAHAEPASWSRPDGGNIRNQVMVNKGHDICVGFPFAESKGTLDCMDRAVEAGIPTYYVWGYEIKPWTQLRKRTAYNL